MDSVLNFFIQPYIDKSAFDIFLEVMAVIFGLISVVCAKKESIWVYPTGIICTITYIYICYAVGYYGDLIINIYYTIMSIYGWYLWSRSKHKIGLKITWCTKKDWITTILITLFTMIFTIIIYLYFNRFESWLNYVDVLTTGLAFGSMWLMAKKKVENWLGWLVTDIISAPLYFAKGLGFSGIQFTIFLILSYQAYIIWKKDAEPRRQ